MNAPSAHPPAVRTTCPYCGVGCGVLAAPDGNGGATISGDPAHPANFGRLCSKGSALGETLVARSAPAASDAAAGGRFARCASIGTRRSTRVAGGLRAIVDRDGPDAIAFYLSGQLLTEDYYVANKLMKGFLGSANVDTNSRLCMASSVAGHRRAFGADTVPGIYQDLDEADLIVLVGSNAAWCHPVLYQRMMARQARARHQTDRHRSAPHRDGRGRRSVSCRSRPAWTRRCSAACLSTSPTRALDYGYIDAHTTGLCRDARARPRDRRATWPRPPARRRSTKRDVARFFELFRTTRARRHLLLAGRQSVGARHRQGQRHHQLSISRPAASAVPAWDRSRSPASPTPWADARSAGSPISSPPTWAFRRPSSIACAASGRRRAWRPREGLKAVDMFEAIERGTIKALWVMATNPAVSLPRAGAMRAALEEARTVRRLRERALATTPSRPARRCCCRPRPGARRTAPSPIRSGASRASARSCRCRARRGPIGGSSARWRGAWALRRRIRLSVGPPTCFASTPRFPRSRITGERDFDIGALGVTGGRRLRRARSGAVAGARRRSAGRAALLRRRRLFHRRPPGPFRRAASRRGCATRPTKPFRCGSTPDACATSGTR